MDKRIKLTEKEMCNYFIREQKVMEYGEEFFRDICACLIMTGTYTFVNDEVLPLSCYNLMDEYIKAVEEDSDYVTNGGFVEAGKKQAYIRIGIDTSSDILSESLKKTIRHEIIHYYLWVLGLPHRDNNLEFWCLCHIYDGGAYEQLSEDDQSYYELFQELYDTHVANLQWNLNHLITGQMITGLSEVTKDKYVDYVMETVNALKRAHNLS